MAITKARRQELVAEYTELLGKSKALFLAEYSGLTMKGMDTVRGRVRQAKGEFHVAKNTLAELALRQAGYPIPGGELRGATAVGFAFEAVPAVAKAIVDFTRETEFVKIKGGLLGNQLLSPDQVKALASLPPLPVVRAQLLGLLSAPASRVAGVVAGSVRQVVSVVKAYSEKEAEAAPAA